MRYFIALIVLIISANLHAAESGISQSSVNQAGWSKLTEEQKAEVLKTIANQASQSKTTNSLADAVDAVTDPSKVDKWVNVGERIGRMMGGAAKEVGVQVNEFVKTPVGMMTMGLIVWHYGGKAFIHVLAGFAVLVFGFTFLIWLNNRQVTYKYEYSPDKTNIFGNARLVNKTIQGVDDDNSGWYIIIAAVTLVVSLITTFTF